MVLFFFKIAFLSAVFYTQGLFSQSGNDPGTVSRVVIDSDIIYELPEFTSIYEDKSKNLTIEEVKRKEFIPNTKGTVTYGLRDSAFWVKFKIKNNTSISIENWFLVLEFPQLDLVEFYFPLKNGTYLIKKGGDLLPFTEREIKMRFLNFRLPPDLDTESDIYFRVETLSAMILPLFLGTESKISEKNHNVQIYSGFYLGILFIMMVYNFFLYLSLKESVYIYYVLFTAFTLLYMISFLGFGFEYIWGNQIFLQSKIIFLSSITMILFLILFTRDFLNTKSYVPRADKLIKYSIFSFPFLILFVLFSKSLIMNKTVTSIGFIYSIILPISGFFIWIKKNKVARLFIIAWMPFLLALNLSLLRIFGVIEKFGAEINYLVQIANVLEAAIFSFALADRVNILKEKIKINLEKSNIDLEKKVIERTAQLNTTIKRIKQDLNFAKRIQTQLLPIHIHNLGNLNFYSKYIPIDEVGGDFFDIAQLENKNTVRVLIADATGHGVEGALITMLIKSEYEILKKQVSSPAELLNILNNVFFLKYNTLATFFSCFIADIDTGKETITYASAGHPEQILIAKKKIQLLTRTGKILGVIKNFEYEEEKVAFKKGDKLLLFTDGLFEEFDETDQEFGEARIYELVDKIKSKAIKLIVEESLIRLNTFLKNNEPQDDITLIGIEWN